MTKPYLDNAWILAAQCKVEGQGTGIPLVNQSAEIVSVERIFMGVYRVNLADAVAPARSKMFLQHHSDRADLNRNRIVVRMLDGGGGNVEDNLTRIVGTLFRNTFQDNIDFDLLILRTSVLGG